MRLTPPVTVVCGLLVVCAVPLEAFHVSIRQMPGVENSVYTGAEIEANGEKLSLMIPSGWRAGNSPQPDSFTLQPRSGGGPLTIQCWPQDAATVLSSATALRQTVAPLLPAATVNGEFPAYSGYGAGRGVDLSFAVQGHSMQARLVVIPLTQGFVSFVLACPSEESATALQSFGVILTSFQRFNPALPPNRPGQFAAAPPEKPKAALAEPTQVFDVLHTEPSVAEDSQAIAAPISIFDGKEDYIRFGLVFVLYSIFMKSMFARHMREAEIRLLCGGYLSDGTEVARFTMPELFAPAPVMDLRTGPLPEEIDPVAAGVKPRAQMAEFFAQAPEHLAKIHSALSALKEVESSGIVEDRQPALLKLHALVCELRDQATVWELRPAWQISSALELLLKRVADKPKDFTPSIVRTVAAAVDVLRDVCVPGIRTNLLMDPPPRILAVDDDALCRRALQFAFEKANLIPDLAESGERAVELANAHTYDVVFMDIQMPGIGGLVACNNIHGTNKNSDVPVIFVTVQSDFNTRAESRSWAASISWPSPSSFLN